MLWVPSARRTCQRADASPQSWTTSSSLALSPRASIQRWPVRPLRLDAPVAGGFLRLDQLPVVLEDDPRGKVAHLGGRASELHVTATLVKLMDDALDARRVQHGFAFDQALEGLGTDDDHVPAAGALHEPARQG